MRHQREKSAEREREREIKSKSNIIISRAATSAATAIRKEQNYIRKNQATHLSFNCHTKVKLIWFSVSAILISFSWQYHHFAAYIHGTRKKSLLLFFSSSLVIDVIAVFRFSFIRSNNRCVCHRPRAILLVVAAYGLVTIPIITVIYQSHWVKHTNKRSQELHLFIRSLVYSYIRLLICRSRESFATRIWCVIRTWTLYA